MTGISDYFLLPRSIFLKIGEKLPSLFIGFFVVGFLNIILFTIDRLNEFSVMDTKGIIIGTAVLITASFLIGAIDVLFFGIPLYDVFRLFKSKDPDYKKYFNRETKVKVFKIYILANIVVNPFNILFNYAVSKMDAELISSRMSNAIFVIFLLLMVWFYLLFARGINSIYNFKPLFARLVFSVSFLWGFILSWMMLLWFEKLFNAVLLL